MITSKELKELGIPRGPIFGRALKCVAALEEAGVEDAAAFELVCQLVNAPEALVEHPQLGELANLLIVERRVPQMIELRDKPVPYQVWGADQIEAATLEQMDNACRLPVAVRGAQMPDGHVGYGLPIGGVLATRGAVVPYAVGVDIACRMKLSITDVPADRFAGFSDMLRNALVNETAFGMGARFEQTSLRDHDVLDDPDWWSLPRSLRAMKDKARVQLGSSGSGNHFVEWGVVTVEDEALGIPPREYIALLSHSGSRGFGANVARIYTQTAMEKCPLPKAQRHLAWLDLDSAAGQEYWLAMNLAGKYAAANHDCIHRHVLKAAGFKPLLQIENHHNFAWVEEHFGEEVIVHRKGATPAGEGVLGIIPGSMADACYVVRGKGNAASLHSAAHGAGRAYSRKKALESFTMSELKKLLKQRNVELLSAGLDEAPMAYKSISAVMAAQEGLVDSIAVFQPRMVRMADDGGRED